jgi:hypothetical protein
VTRFPRRSPVPNRLSFDPFAINYFGLNLASERIGDLNDEDFRALAPTQPFMSTMWVFCPMPLVQALAGVSDSSGSRVLL